MSLGIHISKKSQIIDASYKSIDIAIERETKLLNLNAAQIYTHGPRAMRKNNMDYAKIKNLCTNNGIDISTHASYVSSGMWKINNDNADTDESRLQFGHIADMLSSAKQIGASGVVIHLPKRSAESITETLSLLANSPEIEELKDYPQIVLEMPASRPDDKTYETPEKLNHLCALIKKAKTGLNWGLCIDTSHQWSCGIKMNESIDWYEWLNDLDEYVRNKISIIHLNGNSATNFGRGKDIHEIIMSPSDGIWSDLISEEMKHFITSKGPDLIKEGGNFFDQLSRSELRKIKDSSLASVVRFAKKHDITIILEINRGAFIHTKFAIDVLAGLLK